LLKANGLGKASVIKPGQKLFVPDAGSVETKVAQAKADAVRRDTVNYQVRPGDSLWGIAKRFGVTTDELQSWNKLAKNSQIRPGDRLKVYTR
jgi:membrane-bound lytic murein transglycosylase D